MYSVSICDTGRSDRATVYYEQSICIREDTVAASTAGRCERATVYFNF